jgi:hypothetical protein
MITTVRRELLGSDIDDSVTEYYPYGNTRVRDIFKDFHFGGKISEDNEVIKVLFAPFSLINFPVNESCLSFLCFFVSHF